MARYLLRGVVLIAIVVGGFLVAKTIGSENEYSAVARRLPEEIAAARAEGIALTPSDLRPTRPVLPAQNAAPLYQRIHALHSLVSPAQQKEEAQVNRLARSPISSDRIKARDILKRRAKEISLAELAVQRPHCDFTRPYEQGPEMLLPEYASLRHMARLLAAKATLEGASGDFRKAFETISVGVKMGRHIAYERVLIAHLVSIAVYAIMDRAFQDVVLANHQ